LIKTIVVTVLIDVGRVNYLPTGWTLNNTVSNCKH
jgi:hypothetical protein